MSRRLLKALYVVMGVLLGVIVGLTVGGAPTYHIVDVVRVYIAPPNVRVLTRPAWYYNIPRNGEVAK